MAGGDSTQNEAEGGPMWGRFFDSIGHDDDGSVLSGSHHATDMRSFASMNELHMQQSPHSEVHPNDSASVMDDDQASALESYARGKGLGAASGVGLAPVPVDDGTYVFKFRTPSGRTHRFQARHDGVEHLREIVAGKLATDPFFTEFAEGAGEGAGAVRPDPGAFQLAYTDADGDTVLMTSDHDVAEAVKIARGAGTDRVVLFVQGGRGWAEAGAGQSAARAAEAALEGKAEVREVEKAEKAETATPVPAPAAALGAVDEEEEEDAPKPTRRARAPVPAGNDDVMGIPKDLLLPASIGVLAVVIVGVFTISRLTANNY